jgi:hypothetical protein
MSDNKIDITSTAVEKGLDLVKGFLEKLTGATIEETGLLIADNIKLIRFKNQLKILTKAQKIVQESDINVKQISLKALVPLLEYSSLEDDETLQDKWTNLLVNFIDSNEKYESTIFPFILNQLSSNEVLELERIFEIDLLTFDSIKLSGIETSNITRLGLIARVISEDGFIFTEDEISPIYYNITDLGNEFIKCCLPRK